MARPYRTPDDERDVFRALAHPVRRAIVTAAIDQACSFDHLQQLVHRSNATVASHLRILREARLLVPTRIGKAVTYRVNRPVLRAGAKWLAEIASRTHSAPAAA